MNENYSIKTNPLVGIFGSDNSFILLLISLVGAYGVKRYFDSADKAMEHGYNTTVKSPKYGEMKFERNHETEAEKAQAADNQSLGEEEIKDYD